MSRARRPERGSGAKCGGSGAKALISGMRALTRVGWEIHSSPPRSAANSRNAPTMPPAQLPGSAPRTSKSTSEWCACSPAAHEPYTSTVQSGQIRAAATCSAARERATHACSGESDSCVAVAHASTPAEMRPSRSARAEAPRAASLASRRRRALSSISSSDSRSPTPEAKAAHCRRAKPVPSRGDAPSRPVIPPVPSAPSPASLSASSLAELQPCPASAAAASAAAAAAADATAPAARPAAYLAPVA
mmetsp:Transcript_7850/g.23048  ORF Transcript_7850/g.23048 Transcript_7850/m.23048 type:complete len:247 (+) Transcript_7850:695-1435(+)